MNRNKISDIEAVRQYYMGEREDEELTAHQLQKLRRIKAVYHLLLDTKPTKLIISVLQEEFSISESQAVRDIQETEKLFGSLRKSNKDFNRHWASEKAKDIMRRAQEIGGIKGLHIENAALRNFIETSGFHQEDSDLPDFSKIEPHIIVVVLPEVLQNSIAELNSQGVVDLNRMPEGLIIDIPHEEISDNESE